MNDALFMVTAANLVLTGSMISILAWALREIKKLKLQDVNFDLILDASMATSPAGVILVNDQGVIEKANHACYLLTKVPDTLVGRNISTLIPERYQPRHNEYRELYMQYPRVRQMGAGRRLFLHRYDDTDVEVNIGLTPLTKGDGSVHVVAYITEVGQHNPVVSHVFQK